MVQVPILIFKNLPKNIIDTEQHTRNGMFENISSHGSYYFFRRQFGRHKR